MNFALLFVALAAAMIGGPPFAASSVKLDDLFKIIRDRARCDNGGCILGAVNYTFVLPDCCKGECCNFKYFGSVRS